MRIAEFVNMNREDVAGALDRFGVVVDGEGTEPYDFAADSGTALLMDTAVMDVYDSMNDGDRWPTILRIIVGKAFRLGCSYGRAVVAPEERE